MINHAAKAKRYCAVADESQAPPAGHPPTFGGLNGTCPSLSRWLFNWAGVCNFDGVSSSALQAEINHSTGDLTRAYFSFRIDGSAAIAFTAVAISRDAKALLALKDAGITSVLEMNLYQRRSEIN